MYHLMYTRLAQARKLMLKDAEGSMRFHALAQHLHVVQLFGHLFFAAIVLPAQSTRSFGALCPFPQTHICVPARKI